MGDFFFQNTKFNLVNIVSGTFNEDLQGHVHSKDSYELHFITGGVGQLITLDNMFELKRGDFFITGPLFWHEQLTNKNDALKEICIYLKIVGDAKDFSSQLFTSKNFYIGNNNELIENTFRKINNMTKNSIYNISKRNIYAQLLINEFISLYYPTDKKDYLPTIEDKKTLIIEKAFLYQHSTITLVSLSAQLGTSERQTERVLKKYYGKTFKQMKNDALMSQAILRLQNDDLISNISSGLGYSNASAFQKAFKNHYGITPGEYKKKYKLGEIK